MTPKIDHRGAILRRPDILLTLLMFCSLSSLALGSSFVLLSREELVSSADAVVVGKVLSMQSSLDENSNINTFIALEVKRDLFDQLPPGTILYLKEPGGRFQGISGWAFGASEFEVGEDVVVFVRLQSNGFFRVAHMFQGKFRLKPSGDLEQSRPADVMVLGEPAPHFRRLEEIEQSARGVKAPALGPFATELKLEIAEPLVRFSMEGVSDPIPRLLGKGPSTEKFYTLAGGGIRWRQFDSGTSVPFLVNPNLSPVGTVSATMAAVNSALQGWNSVAGTRILLVNGGQTALSGRDFSDNTNVISFGDPQGIIPDPSGCSGTLAITYVTFTASPTHTVNGTPFKEILQADLVFNNGFECFLSNQSNLAEVTGHEMGHAIGFAHSSDTYPELNPVLADALMYFRAHGDGRGASVKPDDILAAQFVYPGGVSAPAPVIAAFNPAEKFSGSNPFTLTVTGSNFDVTSTVRWNGSNRSTTFVSTTQLQASILASDVASAANASVTVFNTVGGVSNTASFLVRSSPLTDNSAFVRQQYLDFLNRDPDAAGLNFWTSQLNSGTSSRAQVVYEYFRSPEFQDNGAYIARLYTGILFRRAEYDGFLFWLSQLNSGAQTKDQIISLFISSPEFQSRFGGSLTNREFVWRLYLNILFRDPDQAGSDYWTAQLDSGALTRTQMTRAFVESPEYIALTDTSIFVQLEYIGLLRRAADDGGFQFWVSQFNSGRSRLDLINQFILSTEYRSRFQ